jgi:hypothetical protein
MPRSRRPPTVAISGRAQERLRLPLPPAACSVSGSQFCATDRRKKSLIIAALSDMEIISLPRL